MRNYSNNKLTAYIAFLAMSLSFLAQVTPLWAKNVDGTSIVICSSFGTKTIIIDENGNEVPALPTRIKNNCVMCINSHNAANAQISIFNNIIAPPQSSSKPYFGNNKPPTPKISSVKPPIRAPPKYS